MDWRDIPSLSALRAFEAAARLDSFSAAARELNVTHAAIAQHVRALEDHFSQSLMERDGRAMPNVILGDTVGWGDPHSIKERVQAVRDTAPGVRVGHKVAEIYGFVLRPEPAGRAEVGNAAFGRDPGPGEPGDAVCLIDQLLEGRKGCHVFYVFISQWGPCRTTPTGLSISCKRVT